MSITWVLEREAFSDNHEALKSAAVKAGHRVELWDDEWAETCKWPALEGERVVFHGSLGNASYIQQNVPWKPGAFCQTKAFFCSAWYPRAERWILNERWCVSSVRELVENTEAVLSRIKAKDKFFVRPDSSLKPFSGRVLGAESVGYEDLDHGFYYDDIEIPVLIAPVKEVNREWRLVVVDDVVVTGCQYSADSRSAIIGGLDDRAAGLGEEIAKELDPPELVYVVDICESGDGLRLLELNPFSGADLYACDRSSIVRAMDSFLR